MCNQCFNGQQKFYLPSVKIRVIEWKITKNAFVGLGWINLQNLWKSLIAYSIITLVMLLAFFYKQKLAKHNLRFKYLSLIQTAIDPVLKCYDFSLMQEEGKLPKLSPFKSCNYP